MTSSALVVVALLTGLAVGAGVVVVVLAAWRRGRTAQELTRTALPDGAAEVIGALESSGVVLDPSNNVVVATPSAFARALVSSRGHAHEEIVRAADEVRRSGEPVVRELVLSRGPFGEASLRLRVRAVRLGSRYVVALVEDRTEAFRVESMRRDFVANISHELKTPIGAVQLLAEAVDAAADDPGQVRRFASRMTAETERLARITQDIIELSRVQSVDVVTDAEAFDATPVVKLAVDQNRVAAEARGIELAVRGDKRARVVGDASMLGVAVHNLVRNALQYSPDGARVGVGVRRAEGLVEISVTDQGVGIAEEDQERVFERFFRVDPARARTTGGTGLGLAIVKHVVQNHGGEVRLWSQPGRGSTFTLRLPHAEDEDAGDTDDEGEA